MIEITTNLGVIKLELDFENTPLTANNFLQYVSEKFYTGTIFHRVISNFMIQGGGMVTGMVQKTTNAPIKNEANRAKSNMRGTVAMARTSDPHSATSQFFINVTNNNFLNFTQETPEGWGYCVFGTVVEGMEVVDKIKAVATGNSRGHSDVPIEDVVISSVVILDTDADK